MKIQKTDLIVAFLRASLDTPTRKKEKWWIAGVTPVLSPNLIRGILKYIQDISVLPLHSWVEDLLP